MGRLITRTLQLAAAFILGSTPAWAQTLYPPVQYQFGRYGEIFYGGTSATLVSNQFQFMPEVARNMGLPGAENNYVNGLPSPYTPAIFPMLQIMGWPSATDRTDIFHAPYDRRMPQIFTDLEPGTDVARRGFTINDARNEAYLNVPRYQTGMVGAPEVATPEMASVRGRPLVGGPKPAEKARELLNWAKATHTRGNKPLLVQALVKEAAKYDAGAAEKTRSEIK